MYKTGRVMNVLIAVAIIIANIIQTKNLFCSSHILAKFENPLKILTLFNLQTHTTSKYSLNSDLSSDTVSF